MSWTQSDVERMERNIADGVLEVRFSDGSATRYASLDEMQRALDRMRSAVTSASAAAPSGSFTFTGTKGL